MRSNGWITLLAYEARIRHAADCRREQGTAKRLVAMRSRVLANLRSAIALDIEGFLGADGDKSGSALTCHNGSSAQGFVVVRVDESIGRRSLAVDVRAATLSCRYDLGGGSIDGTDQRVLTIDIGNDGSALSLWNGGLDRTFATVDVLSAFLLAPILAEC